MRFNTEAERAAHPVASLIPEYLFPNDYLYSRNPSDIDLRLMQITLPELPGYLDEIGQLPSHTYSKHTAWISIALVHSCLSDRELYELGERFQLTPQTIFWNGVTLGRLSLLEYMHQQNPRDIEAALHDYSLPGYLNAYGLAAAGGYLPVLQWIEEKAPAPINEAMRTNPRCIAEACRCAAMFGHLTVLTWLASKLSSAALQNMIRYSHYDIFVRASLAGHVPVLQWIVENASDNLEAMVSADSYYAPHVAVREGQLEVFQWLATVLPTPAFEAMMTFDDDEYHLFDEAATLGYLELVQWLAEYLPHHTEKMVESDRFSPILSAAHRGHNAVVQYLLQFPSVLEFAKHPTQEKHKTLLAEHVADFLRERRREIQEKLINNPYSLLLDFSDAEEDDDLSDDEVVAERCGP